MLLSSTKRQSIFCGAFTLIELLVVIGITAVLMAITFPVLRRVRELSHRTVCLSNLRQLTMGWLVYAEDHNGDIVSGRAIEARIVGNGLLLEPWLGNAFGNPENRDILLADQNKGALWPYIGNVDVYRCLHTRDKDRAISKWRFEASTYSAFTSANGLPVVEGTFMPVSSPRERRSMRVGNTYLWLSNLSDIINPGAAQRGVFMDVGMMFIGSYTVEYLYPEYRHGFPKHHAKGTTFSFADGHAEYWKWKAKETLNPKLVEPMSGGWGKVYRPRMDEGLTDLQRLQRAMWGRIGYSLDDVPSN